MLTGKTRYRTSLFGKLILQVEVLCTHLQSYGPEVEEGDYLRWRDATSKDITHEKLLSDQERLDICKALIAFRDGDCETTDCQSRCNDLIEKLTRM